MKDYWGQKKRGGNTQLNIRYRYFVKYVVVNKYKDSTILIFVLFVLDASCVSWRGEFKNKSLLKSFIFFLQINSLG